MKVYQTSQIRNVALAGHSGAGKTSLAEALLHANGLIERKGSVSAGTTASDYDPIEKSRRSSVNATLIPIELPEHKINLMDCPGYRDFLGEIKNAIRISEMCLLVVDAETGVEVGTEFAWAFAHEYDIPIAVVVNRMDMPRADFAKVLESVDRAFEAHTIPVTIPIGQGADFRGVIDLLDMKAVYDQDGKKRVEEIPADMLEEAKAARRALVEAAAEGDDELTEHFLDHDSLTDEELRLGLREDMQAGRFIPVVCASAEKEIGLAALVHFLIEECPTPDQRGGFRAYAKADDPSGAVQKRAMNPDEPFSAFVFKTVNDDFAGRLSFFKVVTGNVTGDCPIVNMRGGETMKAGHVFAIRGKQNIPVERLMTGDIGVFAKLNGVHTGDTLIDPRETPVRYVPTQIPPPTVAVSLQAHNKSEEDKISLAIHRLLDTDPTLKLERDSLLQQTILSGMGETHIDVAVERLRAQAKIAIDVLPPRVQYRETITRPARGQGKFKKQSGGRGQYGDCWIKMEPAERGAGFSFSWDVVGGVIPTNYQSSVLKGIEESLRRGILAGYPVVDIKVSCYDGTYHAVDSSDMAFSVAASMAFKQVAPNAGPVILEPIMTVSVTAPEQYMGDILGYLTQHRGRIAGSEQEEGHRVHVTALVPQGEMATFSRDLRSLTQGRSIFTSSFSHYEPCPPAIQEKVVRDSRIVHEEQE
ncbi:elongation factor G [bacterium]|nr:elongation factor G [bacterium]